MNEVMYYFLLGTGIGLVVGGLLGFPVGWIFQARVSARSKFTKMEAEFEERAARVRKSIDAARERFQ